MNALPLLGLMAAALGAAVTGLAVRGRRLVGWPLAGAVGLVCGLTGFFGGSAIMSWIALAAIGFGIAAPGLVFRWASRRVRCGDLSGGARIVQRLNLLRRSHSLASLAEVWAVTERAHLGDTTPASALLATLTARTDTLAQRRYAQLVALLGDWRRGQSVPALDLQVRSLCELGFVEYGVETAARALSQRPRLVRGAGLAKVRNARAVMLAPLAFSGRISATAAQARGLNLPKVSRLVWAATALAAAGRTDDAIRTLDRADTHATSPLARAAIARRRAHLPTPVTLGPAALDVLNRATQEQHAGALLQFGQIRRSPAALMVLALMVGAFVRQMMRGPLDDPALVYQLGALLPGTPLEPWRLLAYASLHAGYLHLGANLFGVALIGPAIARGLGALGLGLVFVGSVLGAGLAIQQWGGHGLTIGASGGAMGLLGALVALAWLHPDAHHTHTGWAIVRFGAVVALTQSAFDAMVPQVSGAGHAAGLLAGFVFGVAGCGVLRGWRLLTGRARSAG